LIQWIGALINQGFFCFVVYIHLEMMGIRLNLAAKKRLFWVFEKWSLKPMRFKGWTKIGENEVVRQQSKSIERSKKSVECKEEW